MDSNKRVRFNIIDFFIIVCLIAACCFFGYYAANRARKNAAAASDTITYTIKVTNLSASSANLFVKGDNISRDGTFAPAGKIISVEKSPHSYVVPDAAGMEYIYTKVDSRFDVLLTVESTFSEDETSFIVGGDHIKTGQPFQAFTDRIAFTGTVYAIMPDND